MGRTVRIAGGIDLPYPEPTSAAASAVGRANRRKDTKPEVALRSALHRRGLRFRKDLRLVIGSVRVRPDVVFTARKVAVFVDGCFWHGCPQHGTTPRSNVAYWGPKLQANAERDRRVDDALRAAGWHVVRRWEHDSPDAIAAEVSDIVESLPRHGDRGCL